MGQERHPQAMRLCAVLSILLMTGGCVAVKVVDAAASTAVGVTKTTVKAGGAAIDATVDTFDADEDELADSAPAAEDGGGNDANFNSD